VAVSLLPLQAKDFSESLNTPPGIPGVWIGGGGIVATLLIALNIRNSPGVIRAVLNGVVFRQTGELDFPEWDRG
jgi:hypothetical protein